MAINPITVVIEVLRGSVSRRWSWRGAAWRMQLRTIAGALLFPRKHLPLTAVARRVVRAQRLLLPHRHRRQAAPVAGVRTRRAKP